MKFIVPIILFLDEDHQKSAQYLTNFHLEYGIKNSIQVLLCSIYYMVGFRNKTIFKHYVSKDRWDETRFQYFPQYPLKSMPKFSYYNSYESKWCRMCKNHYRYLSDYLGCMLEEYYFRYNSEHNLAEMYDFLRTLPYELAARRGLKLVSLKDSTKLQLPWKNLPIKFRKKDIIAGYRAYYKSIIPSALDAFIGTKRDIPDFLLDKPLYI